MFINGRQAGRQLMVSVAFDERQLSTQRSLPPLLLLRCCCAASALSQLAHKYFRMYFLFLLLAATIKMLNRIVVITTICISEERQREAKRSREGARQTEIKKRKAQKYATHFAIYSCRRRRQRRRRRPKTPLIM